MHSFLPDSQKAQTPWCHCLQPSSVSRCISRMYPHIRSCRKGERNLGLGCFWPQALFKTRVLNTNKLGTDQFIVYGFLGHLSEQDKENASRQIQRISNLRRHMQNLHTGASHHLRLLSHKSHIIVFVKMVNISG